MGRILLCQPNPCHTQQHGSTVKPQHAESQALSATHGWKVEMEATDPEQGMDREFTGQSYEKACEEGGNMAHRSVQAGC